MRKHKKDQEVKNEESVEAADQPQHEMSEEALKAEIDALGDAETASADADSADLRSDEESHVALMETPEAAVQRLTEEVEQQKEKYLRLAAEFDNFRKRVDRQRSEIRQNARSEVIRSLLETLDNFARVTELNEADASAADVIAGVQMVERGLLRELEAAGLEKVGNVNDPFDPNDHEAVSTAAAPDEEMVDHVAAVFQVGYRLGKTLLRPARVQVYVARIVDLGAGE